MFPAKRIPPALRRVLTRASSLLILFQRAPMIQWLFPEAGMIGGASLANSSAVAVTTVIGLGAYDSVVGATTIDEVLPLAVTGASSSPTTAANAINVPATVSAALNFEFRCTTAPSRPKSWSTTTLPAGLAMSYTTTTPTGAYNNYLTGTPASAGIFPVTLTVWEGASYGPDSVAQRFNICVLGFTTQPAATTTIDSGQTTTLTCVATGNPVGTTRHPGNGVLTYEWYQGSSGTLGAVLGTSASFTTPALTSTTSYWVRIKSVLGASTVYARSNTAVVTVNTASPYDIWASGLPAGQKSPGQIPFADGVTNLEKFAFNMNPLAPDVRRLAVGANHTAGLPGNTLVGGNLRIEFLRRKASTSPGVTYLPQFSSDLGGWADYAGTPVVTSIDTTWERVVVDDPSPGSGTNRFARIKLATP